MSYNLLGVPRALFLGAVDGGGANDRGTLVLGECPTIITCNTASRRQIIWHLLAVLHVVSQTPIQGPL